jgi:hypothetical protein
LRIHAASSWERDSVAEWEDILSRQTPEVLRMVSAMMMPPPPQQQQQL